MLFIAVPTKGNYRAQRSLIDDSRYGWVVVAAAFTLMFVGFGAAYSFAAFFTAFEAEFGASRGDVALVFSRGGLPLVPLRRARRHAGRPLRRAPRRARRRRLPGARRSGSRAVAQSLSVLYVTYSIGIGIGVGLVYVPSVGAVQPWFSANRAFASGLAVAGIGAGNIAGPLLAAWWIELFGWRGAYLALARLRAGPGRVAAALLCDRPRRKTAQSGRHPAARGAAHARRSGCCMPRSC